MIAAAKHDVVGYVCNKRADECVVPVVPDVDVDRLSEVNQDKKQVNDECQRNDNQTNGGAECNCCTCWPTDVDDVEGQTKAVDHLLNCRSNCGTKQLVDDEVKAEKANADHKASLEALTKACSQSATDDGQDDWHHDCNTEALKEREE